MSVSVGEGNASSAGVGEDDVNTAQQHFALFQYAIYGWVVPVISLIGLLGNGVAVLVLNHREVRPCYIVRLLIPVQIFSCMPF